VALIVEDNLDKLAKLADVFSAYRIFLRREPDSAGISAFMKEIENGLTIKKLRELIEASEEYRSIQSDIDPHVVRVEVGDGICVFVDKFDPDFSGTIISKNTWEPHVLELMRKVLKPGGVCVDVGANVGMMSFHAAAVVGSEGKVIAFEPSPSNVNLFLRGVAENKTQDIIRLFPVALGETTGLATLGGTSNGYLVRGGSTTQRHIQVMTGDAILSQESRIDLIKLDIEGFEPYALRGMANTLKRSKPHVLCEFNPRCLYQIAGLEPIEFARELFGITDTIDAIEYDGRSNTVSSPEELLALWRHKNEEAVKDSRLPNGMLHFDLFFKVK
jgi:FkbM family methyltransferase